MEKAKLLQMAGLCGVISPVVAFACIIFAIGNYPSFSWQQNDLSDLGVASGISAPVFNAGLVLAAGLSMVFTYGLWHFIPDFKLGKIGVALFGISLLALAGIGIVTENTPSLHQSISLAFFFLFPLAMLFICGGFLQSGTSDIGNTTMKMFLLALLAWGLHWTGTFGKGLAMPELVSSLALSFWGITASMQMLGLAGKKPNKP